MGVIVPRAGCPGCLELKSHDHQVRMIGQDLTQDAFTRLHNWKDAHFFGSLLTEYAFWYDSMPVSGRKARLHPITIRYLDPYQIAIR